MFWFEGKWKLRSIDGRNYISPLYTFDKLELEKVQGCINDCVNKIIHIKNETSYLKVLIIYEWLTSYTEYGFSETSGQTLYDALVKKKAVCKGLSKAYQFLLSKLGIFSTLKEGTIDGCTKHIWNVVEIDGIYYNVDVSMAYECFSYLFEGYKRYNKYRCFAISDFQMRKTHRLIKSAWPHLSCDYNFQEGRCF